MFNLKLFGIAVVVLLIIDFTWLSLMRPFYDSIVTGDVRVWSALLAWLMIAIAIVVFVPMESLGNAVLYGAVLGFVMYGLYDFTNYAIMENYPLRILVVDIIWGTFLCGFVSGLLHYISKLI